MRGKTVYNHAMRAAAAVLCAALSVYAFHAVDSGVHRWAGRIKASHAAKKIIESRKGYLLSKTRTSEVYYTLKDKEYVGVIEGIIGTYLPLLCDDFDLRYTPYVTLIIYPDKETMYGAIGYSAPANGSWDRLTPTGAYCAGFLAALSPSEWAREPADGETETDAFLSNGPVIHELAHLVLDKKTKGNYTEWFAEGAALFYENKYTGYEWKAPPSSKAVSYKELSDGFKYINGKESYRKSYEIVKFIESGDKKSLQNIYGALEAGKSVSAALKAELGVRFEELDGL